MADKKEESKINLYITLHRLGIAYLPKQAFDSNTYIDSSGYVILTSPDGAISSMGKMSFSGDFICQSSLDD